MDTTDYFQTDKERQRKAKQRSRTGCKTCRSRKVKCDEYPGGCKNCERLDLICPNSNPYLDTSRAGSASDDGNNLVPTSRTQTGIRRSRTYRSCGACRGSKSRCSGDRPVCERCRQRGMECVYEGKQVPDWVELSSKIRSSKRSGSCSPSGGNSPPRSGQISPSRLVTNTHDYDGSDFASSSSQEESINVDLTWLLAINLPNPKARLMALLDEYFVNVHSLRCFGFVHRATLVQQLDGRLQRGLSEDVLLLAICALGAKFFALRHASDSMLEAGFALKTGSQWAKKAQSLLLADLNIVSVEKGMSAVLLYEHEIRVGNYASALVLGGLAIRICQSLGLNSEMSNDLSCESPKMSPSMRESRRRLAWSAWTVDAFSFGEGDGSSLIADSEVQLQLPCNERNFYLQKPSITEVLQPWKLLPFAPHGAQAEVPDLPAQFIRLTYLRKQVLKHVRRQELAQEKGTSQHGVETVLAALQTWHDNLPVTLQFTETALCMRKKTMQLGGLISLHVLYHRTASELCRVDTMPGNPMPHGRGTMQRLQALCLKHASAIPLILEEALHHGYEAIADPCLVSAAHDSSVVLAQYSQDQASFPAGAIHFERPPSDLVQLNLRALKIMKLLHTPAVELHSSVQEVIHDTNPSALAATMGTMSGSSGMDASESMMGFTSPPSGSSLSAYPVPPTTRGGLPAAAPTFNTLAQSTIADVHRYTSPRSSLNASVYGPLPEESMNGHFQGLPQQIGVSSSRTPDMFAGTAEGFNYLSSFYPVMCDDPISSQGASL
ncbi:hypothetical protein MCOR27_004796 [Pyricularia oryzae]|uniref:Zn(2)-C6 fungal-type domain-containing protein n=2 Tax=Pyricularia TaxID=48558 RepID=A0ABQ8NYK6_PYRGI|nr:hypothetical protein MCOR01_008689 [Pyricularia oryzae]KAI6303073.1 hypothetical protein MCOR33_001670 [Pyricularia grisea]KAH9439347.1 hypothetical protein MCOR02_002906 [Pyricularia oryzae]KAI6252653.1 hypothetical protein MCOR19_010739 [Pyricularia oryzae]KAI6273935.1 hypothetical protein MCOR26_006686 [Pyricularia oryzae]